MVAYSYCHGLHGIGNVTNVDCLPTNSMILVLCIQSGYLANQMEPVGGGGMGGLTYDVADGTFTLTARSYIKISCEMDFLLYPFDTQICKFWMRPDKDNRYQVKNAVKKI